MVFNKALPLWGPYSKKYMGISRIIDSMADLGVRFDFTPHPTLWNSATPVPNVTVPSNYHLWECSDDYSYYSYRYELLWKDLVYADVSFSKISDEAYLLRCEFVNNTDLNQNCLLNLFSSLEFPSCDYIEVKSKENIKLLKANDYDEYEYARARTWDNENPDGMFKGMFVDNDFYLGKGLGDRVDNRHVHFRNYKPFGCEKGDRVKFTLNCDGFKNPVMAIRYKTVQGNDAKFTVNGREIIFRHSGELSIMYTDFVADPEFVSLGTAGIELDFIAVCEKDDELVIKNRKREFTPKISTQKTDRGYRVSLSYPYENCDFTLFTYNEHTRFRTLESGSLEDALVNRLSNGDPTYDDLRETFSNSFKRKKSDDGFFQNTLIKSIFMDPHSKHTEFAVIAKGDFEELGVDEYKRIYKEGKAKATPAHFNSEGEKYRLSTSILRSTILTNVVYPVYRRGENVCHHTPGKRWDSFYTWDSGFIGLGLLEFSKKLCRYSLELYLGEEDNRDFAFLLHGSLVPTQFEQYLELIKRTDNKSELNSVYDKLKRYYEFLRGRGENSGCNRFDNGLLTTYDYWYSCSGMDDYPAQVEMIKNRAEEYSCPCLPTSHIIRAAKILKMTAAYLGKDDDIKVFDADIEYSTKALSELAWDEESGYFGYTMYDKDKPYIMKTADGENWNKGFDGVYPIFAGAVDEHQKKRLLEHIKNPNEMWSQAGISAVDMTASYYFDDGYWNGNVWMSHQWFMWKTMLDLGETDFAFEIADRALEMWKRETDFSYSTFECFGIKTRRGGWFHNFGGLSCPVCVWANAYYKPATITTGMDIWTDYQKAENDRAELKFRYFGNNDVYSILVTLSDKNEYTVTLDGKEIDYHERIKGCIEITLDKNIKEGVILCQKK